MMLRAIRMMMVMTVISLAGCEERIVSDLSNEPEYKGIVGSRYEVVGNLSAYGVKLKPGESAQYMTLIPPPGIDGPEIDFVTPVKMGSEIKVSKVVKTNRWPDRDRTLLVDIGGTVLPFQRDVRIDLMRGNEGEGELLLNPKIYRKVEH